MTYSYETIFLQPAHAERIGARLNDLGRAAFRLVSLTQSPNGSITSVTEKEVPAEAGETAARDGVSATATDPA